MTFRKVFPHLGQSKRPMVNSNLFPSLLGRPIIGQVFLGSVTSDPQLGQATSVSLPFLLDLTKRAAIPIRIVMMTKATITYSHKNSDRELIKTLHNQILCIYGFRILLNPFKGSVEYIQQSLP